MTGTKSTDKVMRKDTGTEWYKSEKKSEAHIREDCTKGQEAEQFIHLKFELVWKEACKLSFSNLYKRIIF